MKYINKFFWILSFILIFTMSTDRLSAQLDEVTGEGYHDQGRYYQKIVAHPSWNTFVGKYPNGYYQNDIHWRGHMELAYKDYISGEGATPSQKWFYAWGGVIATDFKYKLKHSPPDITIDGLKLSPPFRGIVDEDIPSDIEIVNELTLVGAQSGIITEVSRSYANQNHDSYVLWDLNYKFIRQYDYDPGEESYVPEQTLNVFLMHNWGWQGMEKGNQTYYGRFRYRCDNWHLGTIFSSPLKAAGMIPGGTRDDLHLSYSMGCDQVTYITKPREPRGSTWGGSYPVLNDRAMPVGYESGDVQGEFTNYTYAGHSTLHADKSASDTSDDLAKPRYLGRLSMTSHWWGSWPLPWWDWCNQDGIEAPGWELGYPDSRAESYAVTGSYQTIGPYLINENEDVKTVFVTAVGGISPAEARYYGNEYMKWYRDGDGDFDNAKMNALIDQGMDSLQTYIDRGYFAYANNYDIPDPPPVPNIEVTSGPALINVKWGYTSSDDFKDSDTGSDDFGEWRVYRKLGNKLVDHADDRDYFTYNLVYRTTSKSETEWDDTGVTKGESYNYYVTCVDDGSQYNSVGGVYSVSTPLESSPHPNRTLKPASSFSPGEDNSDNVLIVPNPYSYGTRLNTMNYTGYPDDIHFVNLPPYCTLKVYTATGDLVKVIEHTTGSGSETWADMRTEANQQPVAGVYILVVENARDINNNTLGKRMYKFVIVR
ncbi:hypothetical protein ACFL40_03760 [candidate division KSB1 bacterium]